MLSYKSDKIHSGSIYRKLQVFNKKIKRKNIRVNGGLFCAHRYSIFFFSLPTDSVQLQTISQQAVVLLSTNWFWSWLKDKRPQKPKQSWKRSRHGNDTRWHSDLLESYSRHGCPALGKEEANRSIEQKAVQSKRPTQMHPLIFHGNKCRSLEGVDCPVRRC